MSILPSLVRRINRAKIQNTKNARKTAQNLNVEGENMQKTISKDGTTVTPDQTSLAARLSFDVGAASLLCLMVLHLLSPEFDLSTRMVSEYALGNYSWVLSLMFITQALSCVALFFALKSQVQTFGSKIGLFFLLAAALGLTMASIFDVRQSLHGLAALIGIPSLSIAALILSVSLGRQPSWSSARHPLLWIANLTWISLVWMIATFIIGLSQNGGEVGATILVGWPNRMLIVSYCAWLMTAARRVNQLQLQNS